MALLPKPRFGEPCNGCGFCCIAQQCDISVALFGEQSLCPALEQAGKSLSCGLVRNTAEYVPTSAWGGKTLTEAFGLLLGAGDGCDGVDIDDDPDAVENARSTIRLRANEAMKNASSDARELVTYFRSPS